MRAVDFAPPSHPNQRTSRIEGEKEVIQRFVEQRKNDRIGVVVFSRQAFTQCPVTLDYSVVLGIIKSLQTGKIEDGTAIGDAIAVSVNRLRDSEVKSKVIILLTDGDNNAGEVAPVQAAEIAASQDIRIYPILVGKGGKVPYPVGPDVFGQMHYQQLEIPTNPELLKQIAEIGKGKFYRAVDEDALAEDLQDILNHLEKTRLMDPGQFTRNTEMYQRFLWPALALILLELVLSWTRFRRFPA
jgi:Ca-activated chloride channel family protein